MENEVRKRSSEPEEDYYKADHGEVLNERYRVITSLGCGAFGSVWKCHDAGETVAVKIAHNRLEFAAKKELAMLEAAAGPGVVELKTSFRFNGGSCLVLEMLHESLLDVCGFEGALPVNRVRAITRDVLRALKRVHELGIVHADIKPENVMLTTSGSVKLVDFGLAFYQDRFHDTARLQTREYRAPEVVLGFSQVTTAIDIWSVACLVFEMSTSQYLFDIPLATHATCSRDEMHLAQAMELLGAPLPTGMVKRCGLVASEWFVKNTTDLKHLHVILPPKAHYRSGLRLATVMVDEFGLGIREARDLLLFLLPMLEFHPKYRAEAYECLYHPWLIDDHADHMLRPLFKN